MPTTGFLPSVQELNSYRDVRPEVGIPDTTFRTVWAKRVVPTAGVGDWHVAASVDVDVEDENGGPSEAILRLRLSDGTTSNPAFVSGPLQRLLLGWTPLPVTGTTTTGNVLAQQWQQLTGCANPTVPANTTKHFINSATAQADWNAAVAAISAAAAGNHEIRFLNDGGTHTGEFRIRGSETVGGGTPNLSGLPGSHNWITQEAGAQIAGSGVTNGGYCIDIAAANHWNIVGLNITSAEGYAIRYMQSEGTAGSPQVCHGNTLRNYGSLAGGGVKIRGWFADITPGNRGGSAHINLTCNSIGDSSTAGGAVREFQECAYLGADNTGATWTDNTHDILVAANDMFNTGSDIFETKPGTYNITFVDNLCHDSALEAGTLGTSIPVGHVTLQFANTPPAGLGQNPATFMARNRLWNLTQASGTVRPPISMSLGGTTVESNIGWGNQFTHLVLVQINSAALNHGTGALTVRCNTDDTAVLSNPNPFGFNPNVVTQSNVPDQQVYNFVGPTTGTAEFGTEGPGSGFAPQTGQTATGQNCTDATNTPNNPHAGALFEDQRNTMVPGSDGVTVLLEAKKVSTGAASALRVHRAEALIVSTPSAAEVGGPSYPAGYTPPVVTRRWQLGPGAPVGATWTEFNLGVDTLTLVGSPVVDPNNGIALTAGQQITGAAMPEPGDTFEVELGIVIGATTVAGHRIFTTKTDATPTSVGVSARFADTAGGIILRVSDGTNDADSTIIPFGVNDTYALTVRKTATTVDLLRNGALLGQVTRPGPVTAGAGGGFTINGLDGDPNTNAGDMTIRTVTIRDGAA